MLAPVGVGLVSGCGYRPLRAGLAGSPRLRVTRTVVRVASLEALAEELATGARAELARHAALADGGLPLRLELVRLEEVGEADGVADDKPVARGLRVRVVARGSIEGDGGFETEDVEATEVVSTPGTVTAYEATRRAAARGAARRAGVAVARAVLGLP